MGSRLTLVFTWSHILFTQRRVVARSAARVSDTRGPELPDANNTDRQLKIFPLEYPLVKVSIGTRKPLRFTPDIERFDLTSFRITVPLGQFRAIFSAVTTNLAVKPSRTLRDLDAHAVLFLN